MLWLLFELWYFYCVTYSVLNFIILFDYLIIPSSFGSYIFFFLWVCIFLLFMFFLNLFVFLVIPIRDFSLKIIVSRRCGLDDNRSSTAKLLVMLYAIRKLWNIVLTKKPNQIEAIQTHTQFCRFLYIAKIYYDSIQIINKSFNSMH